MAGQGRELDKELLCWSGCVDCAVAGTTVRSVAEGDAEV